LISFNVSSTAGLAGGAFIAARVVSAEAGGTENIAAAEKTRIPSLKYLFISSSGLMGKISAPLYSSTAKKIAKFSRLPHNSRRLLIQPNFCNH
jgi:hypothetical protein